MRETLNRRGKKKETPIWDTDSDKHQVRECKYRKTKAI